MAVILKKGSGTACTVVETVRYFTYGVPFGITPGDIEGDGDVDTDDNTNWPGSYQVRCDYDLDGDMDITDENFTVTNNGRTLGRGVLSHSSVANRKGYCGYEHDGVVDTIAHVRHRVLMTDLGRWSRRDPIGHADSLSLYQFVVSNPIQFVDTNGLQTSTPTWHSWRHYRDMRNPGMMCHVSNDGQVFSCDGDHWTDPCNPGGNGCFHDPRADTSLSSWGGYDHRYHPPNDFKATCTSRGNCLRFGVASSMATGFSQPRNRCDVAHPDDVVLRAWITKHGANLSGPESDGRTCAEWESVLAPYGIRRMAEGGLCEPCMFATILVLRVGGEPDFHFYREQPDLTWAHKQGHLAARRLQRDLNYQSELVNQMAEDGYNVICPFLCVPYNRTPFAQ